MPTVKRKTYVCLRCGHGSDPEDPWVSTKPEEEPKQCPKCKSYKWKTSARALYDQVCLQCGDKFKSLFEEGPVKCPRCKSFAWNRSVKSKAGRPRKDRKDLAASSRPGAKNEDEDGDSSEEE